MAGGGSSEMKQLQGEIGDLKLALQSAMDGIRRVGVRVNDLERQIAGLQAALRGGDVGPAVGGNVAKSATGTAEKPAPLSGGSLAPASPIAREAVARGPARSKPAKGKS